MASLSQQDLEMLMAYADGELDAEDAAEVEALLSVDPEARATVARFLADGPMLRAAFGREDGQAEGPLSPADADAVTQDAAPAERRGAVGPGDLAGFARGRNRRDRRRAAGAGGGFRVGFPAIAASLALLVSGVAAGFLAGQSLPGDDTAAATQAAIAELAQTQRQALAAALEQLPNGQTNTWRVADGSAGGSITPTVTYVAEDGAFCREVETEADILGRSHTAVGIACREDGQWRVRYWVVEDPEPVAGLGL